jgi:hypothetical protein
VVGIDPGDAVAQASGAEGNEGSRVAWWWILVGVAGGAAVAFGVAFLVWGRRARPTGRAA